jgi:hypothetical protein
MSKPKDQLATVMAQLNQWRQTKQYNNSRIPGSIRQAIIALFDHYPVHELRDELKLSGSLLYRWAKDSGANQNIAPASSKSPEFITLPKVEAQQDTALVLELAVGEQCQLRLSGNISTAQLDVFTRNIFMHQAGVLS